MPMTVANSYSRCYQCFVFVCVLFALCHRVCCGYTTDTDYGRLLDRFRDWTNNGKDFVANHCWNLCLKNDCCARHVLTLVSHFIVYSSLPSRPSPPSHSLLTPFSLPSLSFLSFLSLLLGTPLLYVYRHFMRRFGPRNVVDDQWSW